MLSCRSGAAGGQRQASLSPYRRSPYSIHTIELEIDAPIELLALHQPMASNLRFIIAALKINTDLERMGTWPQRSHTPRER